MNKIPNNSHQGPAASAASGVNKIGFWPAKDCHRCTPKHVVSEILFEFTCSVIRDFFDRLGCVNSPPWPKKARMGEHET